MASIFQQFAQGAEQGQKVADRRLLQNQQGLALQQEERQRKERMAALDAGRNSEAFKKVIVDQPQFANTLMKQFGTTKEGLDATVDDAVMIKYWLDVDPSGQTAEKYLLNRIESIPQGSGRNSFHSEQVLNTLRTEGVEQVKSNLTKMMDIPNQIGKVKENAPAETQAFNNLLEEAGLNKEERKKAARIKLRLDAAAVGSSSQTISQDKQLTSDVASSEAAITAAKETATLQSKLKLSPKIAEAVALSTAKANLAGAQNKEAKSNKKALAVYDVAFKSLGEALGNTYTGPVAGLMPALTSSAQTANGAVAMVLPTLKGIFREAGEGTFTDGDQKLLTDMAPTRADKPATIKWKLNAIDSIVRTKLALDVSQEADKQGGQIMTDANGNKAMVFPDGTFKEL